MNPYASPLAFSAEPEPITEAAQEPTEPTEPGPAEPQEPSAPVLMTEPISAQPPKAVIRFIELRKQGLGFKEARKLLPSSGLSRTCPVLPLPLPSQCFCSCPPCPHRVMSRRGNRCKRFGSVSEVFRHRVGSVSASCHESVMNRCASVSETCRAAFRTCVEGVSAPFRGCFGVFFLQSCFSVQYEEQRKSFPNCGKTGEKRNERCVG